MWGVRNGWGQKAVRMNNTHKASLMIVLSFSTSSAIVSVTSADFPLEMFRTKACE